MQERFTGYPVRADITHPLSFQMRALVDKMNGKYSNVGKCLSCTEEYDGCYLLRNYSTDYYPLRGVPSRYSSRPVHVHVFQRYVLILGWSTEKCWTSILYHNSKKPFKTLKQSK